MNLLLDSHTLLWLMEGNSRLSATALALIADQTNQLHLSIVSIWEIGIKSGLKKIRLSVPYATFLSTAVNGYGLGVLPVTAGDCIGLEALPFPDKRHRDPFDRMIVVHALRNQLSLVGIDAAFDAYGVTRLW